MRSTKTEDPIVNQGSPRSMIKSESKAGKKPRKVEGREDVMQAKEKEDIPRVHQHCTDVPNNSFQS